MYALDPAFNSAVWSTKRMLPRSSAERWWKRMRVCSLSGFASGKRSSRAVITCDGRNAFGVNLDVARAAALAAGQHLDVGVDVQPARVCRAGDDGAESFHG